MSNLNRQKGEPIERITLSTKELSEATGIPAKQIAILRESGLIKGKKIGKTYFYSIESVKKFIEGKI